MSSVRPEFAENPENRCPVVLVLDTSDSMGVQNKIGALNEGVQLFRDEIMKDEMAPLRVEVAIVKFGTSVELVQDFKTVADFTPTPLYAAGNTPLGAAVTRALAMIEDRKAIIRSQGVLYYRPWIWIMTDGQPTDTWQPAADAAKRAERERKAIIYTVGIGDDADIKVLEQFSAENPPMRIGEHDFKEKLREKFKWLSSSLAKVTNQSPGAQVELPPAG